MLARPPLVVKIQKDDFIYRIGGKLADSLTLEQLCTRLCLPNLMMTIITMARLCSPLAHNRETDTLAMELAIAAAIAVPESDEDRD